MSNHTGDSPHGSQDNAVRLPNDASVDAFYQQLRNRASLTRFVRSPQAVKFPAIATAIDHYLSAHSDCADCILGWVEAISELPKS